MPIKTVIFDCDGVLFDSREANRVYYESLGQAFGRGPLTAEEVEFVHFSTVWDSVAHVLRDRPELIEPAHEFRVKRGYGPFFGLMIPEPGVYDCLDRLKGRYWLAIFTNRSDTIAGVLESHRMKDYFQVVVSCLDVAKPKPEPEGVFKILAATGVQPQETAYVGDAATDAEAAQRAGVHFVAYKNPGLAATVHLDHFDRLPALLEKL
jgi:HAD superfamily hydrolase (TIGR01549 family)